MEPSIGQIVTVFRSRLNPAAGESDGERVTLVTFADRPSHDAWRDHPEHQAAQRAGIGAYYESYSITVGVVDHAASFTRRNAPCRAPTSGL